jgi:hypothetical protein
MTAVVRVATIARKILTDNKPFEVSLYMALCVYSVSPLKNQKQKPCLVCLLSPVHARMLGVWPKKQNGSA